VSALRPVILSEAKNLVGIDSLAFAQSQECTLGTRFFLFVPQGFGLFRSE